MDFGICLLSIIPVRKEPSDKSEMVNQLLFGDLVTIIGVNDSWLNITSDFDGYEGWIDPKQIHMFNVHEFSRLKSLSEGITPGLINKVFSLTEGRSYQIMPGSSIRGIKTTGFEIDGLKYSYSGNLLKTGDQPLPLSVISHARLFLNAPYLWGGRSPFGIDCSGLVQIAFKMAGIALKRDARQQAEQGILISFLEEAAPGDLLFFDNDEGRIVHVGILVENHRILHASGEVRIDPVDTHGIYHQEKGLYTHNIRLIRRVI